MRKLITSFFIAFLLLVTGTSVFGQAAGDFVFINTVSTTDATKMDSTWLTQANWNISDGAGNVTAATRLPGAADNVWVPVGKGLVKTLTAVTNLVSSVTSGSTSVTLSASNASVLPGMAVRNSDNYFGIAPGTYVVSVSGTSVVLSQPATMTNSSMKLSFFTSCKSLNVTGICRISAVSAVMGDITVNSGGVLTFEADAYCTNIVNKGTLKSNTSFRTTQKNIYLGFNGAVPTTGSFTITNDGVFGDTEPKSVAANGSGLKIQYSNQSDIVTIQKSSSSVTGNAFNIAQLAPISGIKTTKNTVLNIKQDMSLLLHNGISFSIQQNDSCEGTTRVCNIDPGVTVYVGYNFHANRNVTTAPQGSFVYNIYGTLDLGKYATSANNTTGAATNTTSLSLCMTTVAGNTGTLTVNVGDGTQANGGKLVVGSIVQMYKQSTQTINLNFKDYSTVEFTGNYEWQVYYQLMINNMPALNLFPKNFYNLTINGSKVLLPVKPNVKGTYTFTKGAYGSAKSNWTASTSTKAFGSSLYGVQGNIINTGTAYYYAPAYIAKGTFIPSTTTPAFTNRDITLLLDTASQYVKPNMMINATGISNDTIISVTGASVVIKNGVSTNNTSTITNGALTLKGLQGTVAPTGTSTNAYLPVFDGSQGLIYLGASEFEGFNQIPTSVKNESMMYELVYSDGPNRLVIDNAKSGDVADVYSVSGMKVASAKLMAAKTNIYVNSGIYIVKINNAVAKVVVK